jgi:H3 lysine-79-specific histone-lysine N-methyltransferase
MKELCDKFNKIIDTHLKLNRGTEAFSARLQERATAKLFRHILAQVYSRAVTDPDKLRDYEPFSPSVKDKNSCFRTKQFLLSRFMAKHHQI